MTLNTPVPVECLPSYQPGKKESTTISTVNTEHNPQVHITTTHHSLDPDPDQDELAIKRMVPVQMRMPREQANFVDRSDIVLRVCEQPVHRRSE
jgi:hypothetical protein